MEKIREKYEAYRKYTDHIYPYGSAHSLKKYRDNHVFDENRSVKWNREEVERRNKEYQLEVETHRRDMNKAWEDFVSEGIEYIKQEFSVGDELAGEIWSFCGEQTSSIDERLEFLDALSYLFGGR